MKALKIIFSILIVPLALSLAFAFLVGLFYGVGFLVVYFNIDILGLVFDTQTFSDYVMGGIMYSLIILIILYTTLLLITFSVEIYEDIK